MIRRLVAKPFLLLVAIEQPADERPRCMDCAKPSLAIEKHAGAAVIAAVEQVDADDLFASEDVGLVVPDWLAKLLDPRFTLGISQRRLNQQAFAALSAAAVASHRTIALQA